jgi:hypothetical protein
MKSDCLHGRYFDICREPRGTSGTNETGALTTTRTQPLFETKEMQIQQDDNGISWTYHLRRKTVNGPG